MFYQFPTIDILELVGLSLHCVACGITALHVLDPKAYGSQLKFY